MTFLKCETRGGQLHSHKHVVQSFLGVRKNPTPLLSLVLWVTIPSDTTLLTPLPLPPPIQVHLEMAGLGV